jgi:hypothetical protein
MIHQPTLTPDEFRRTELWQSIAPAIAQADSGAVLDQQFAIASRRIVEQAGPNIGLALVELQYARSITHMSWANARIFPWKLCLGLGMHDESIVALGIGHAETDDARVISLHRKTELSQPIHRAERAFIIQGPRLDLSIITAPASDYRLKRFCLACNPPENHELKRFTLH